MARACWNRYAKYLERGVHIAWRLPHAAAAAAATAASAAAGRVARNMKSAQMES